MKAIIIILLFGIILSYNTNAAIAYARTFCNRRNPAYIDFYMKGQNAHFVSECMVAGGQKFDGCAGIDSKGMFHNISNLKTCLLLKGWKLSNSKPTNFKAGYPIILKGGYHVMLATGFDGNDIIYCSHDNDRCNAKINAKSVDYFYL